MAASSSQHHKNENLPPPHRLIHTVCDPIQVREACEKSRAAVDGLKPMSLNSSDEHHHQLSHLIEVPNVQNLFLISYRDEYDGSINYWDYTDKEKEEEREWGMKDIMLDLGGATAEQRLEYLRAAANFGGEEMGWVEALSHASDHEIMVGFADGSHHRSPAGEEPAHVHVGRSCESTREVNAAVHLLRCICREDYTPIHHAFHPSRPTQDRQAPRDYDPCTQINADHHGSNGRHRGLSH